MQACGGRGHGLPLLGPEHGLVAALVLGPGRMGDVGGQGQPADSVHRVPVQLAVGPLHPNPAQPFLQGLFHPQFRHHLAGARVHHPGPLPGLEPGARTHQGLEAALGQRPEQQSLAAAAPGPPKQQAGMADLHIIGHAEAARGHQLRQVPDGTMAHAVVQGIHHQQPGAVPDRGRMLGDQAGRQVEVEGLALHARNWS